MSIFYKSTALIFCLAIASFATPNKDLFFGTRFEIGPTWYSNSKHFFDEEASGGTASLGLFFQVPIAPQIYFRPTVAIATQTETYEYDHEVTSSYSTYTYTQNENYTLESQRVDIKFLFHFKTYERTHGFFIDVGPMVSLNRTSDSYIEQDYYSDTDLNDFVIHKKREFGFVIGGGFALGRRIEMDIHYNKMLTRAYTVKNDDSLLSQADSKAAPRGSSVTFGFNFLLF
jgi:hypothetical protein